MRKAIIITTVLLVLGLSRPSGAFQSSVSEDPITGDWTAKVKDTDQGRKLWMTLTSTEIESRRHWSQWSFDLPLQEFSGLNPDADGQTRFALNREAGAVTFDGLFHGGKGVGEYRFTPSATFITAMRNLGYDGLSSKKLFSMTIYDVSTKFVNEMKALGYSNLTTGNLISFRIFNVNEEFIRGMRALGFDNIPASKLVAMRVHKIDEAYVKELREAGINNLTANELVKLRIFGIDGEYIRKMKGVNK